MAVCAGIGALISSGCALNPVANESLKGNWQYTRDDTVINLTLGDPEECELRLSRFVTKDLRKGCRYELSPMQPAAGPSKNYLIFLKDAQGKCDPFADFEFAHDPAAGLVTLTIQNTPFHMQKAPAQ